jgi:uncharacterized protein (TIGR00369 family)
MSPATPPEAERIPGTGAGAWQEPVRGGHPGPARLGLPGIEQLRGMLAGEGPDPPLARLIGMRVTAVTDAAVTFAMPLSRWLVGDSGTIGLGPLTIPADAAMATSILTQLPAWTPFTTTELSLRLLRPPPTEGMIHAEGRVIEQVPPIALADCTMRDDAGTLIAQGSTVCMILPRHSPRAPGPAPVTPDGDGDAPDPWQREPPPESAIEPPLHQLTGLAEHPDGSFTLPASRWFCAPPPGRVQGGVVALLADAAQFSAIRSRTPEGVSYSPIELKVNYLRPLISDGRTARAQATVAHLGRRSAVARADVYDADGRAIAVASGSGLLSAVAPAR